MTTQDFINKAIEGGYKKWWSGEVSYIVLAQTVLDPKAWEAVGKVEGWGEYEQGCPTCKYIAYYYQPLWEHKMHQMIDHLVEGGTIESYLETL